MAQDPVLVNISASNGFSLQTSVVPSAISIQKEARYGRTAIMNRSSEIVTYDSSGCMGLTLNLKFVATGSLQPTDVNNIAKGLMSLTYPVSSGVQGPPVTTVTLGAGTIISGLPFAATVCDIKYGGEQLWDSTGNPMSIDVTISFIGLDYSSVDSSVFGGSALTGYTQLAF